MPSFLLSFVLLPSLHSPSWHISRSQSVTSQKVAFEFFKDCGDIEPQQKPRIADYWAPMMSTPSLPSSRKHLMPLLLFLFGLENWPALKKMQGGKAEKEMKEGEERAGREGERLLSIQQCVSCSLVWGDRRKVGRDGGGASNTAFMLVSSVRLFWHQSGRVAPCVCVCGGGVGVYLLILFIPRLSAGGSGGGTWQCEHPNYT